MAGDLLTHLRDYLVAEGIARVPRVAGAAPPLWIEPRNGAVAPGESPGNDPAEANADAVISLFFTGGVVQPPYESFWRKDVVDFWLRVSKAPTALELDKQLRAALTDKRAWDMAGLEVIESEQWRALGRLDSGPQGFTYVTAYIIETRA